MTVLASALLRKGGVKEGNDDALYFDVRLCDVDT